MRKKFLSVLLVSAMSASLLAGCGDKKDSSKKDDSKKSDIDPSKAPSTDGWDDSKKIYAYSWDDDFEKVLNIILDKYPEYKDYVEYVNLGCASEESLEQITLALKEDKYPSLIPSDVGSSKFWIEDDEVTMDLQELGITADMFKDNYDYALEFAKYDDQIKAVTWQSTAGSVFYNRKIAKEVFGTDDPTEVQAKIADWDSFFAAADEVKAKGYKMVSGVDEIYYAIINAHTEPWIIDDGSKETVKFDDSVATYIEYAKKLYDGDYTNGGTMWDNDWSANQNADTGNVFCYFACPWRIGQFVDAGTPDGSWGAVVGPQSYYWGGTYVCVGKDTPNKELCAFLCYEMAFDPEIGVAITNEKSDAVVNKTANEKLANGEFKEDGNAGAKLLGMNPYETWAAAAEGISQAAATYQDKNYEAIIKDASAQYNNGDIKSVDDAIQYIYDKSESELNIPAAE